MKDADYLVTARRWRPQRFEDLVGQEHVSRTLENAIRMGRVAHAFLFTGVRGVGKTTAARILAKALNCERGPAPTPCNECTNCEEITAGRSVDVIEIDGASNTGVDDVREIIENVRYRPARCRYKIYIIDEVHMLSNSAFNALLKTLEEPPPHVKFIFATTDPHRLPATVQSRCQRYDFRRIPLRLVVERLREIARAEGVEIPEAALFALAREGEGSMRDAQSLLDQVLAFGDGQLTEAAVVDALGIADRAAVRRLADAALDRDAAAALRLAGELHERGHDLRRLVRDLLEYVRDLAVAQVSGGTVVPDLPEEERKAILERAEKSSQEDLQRAFRILQDAEEEIGRSGVPRLVLDMALARIACLPPVVPVGTLIERMEELERRLDGARPRAATAPRRAAAERRAPAAPPPAASEPRPAGASAEPGGAESTADLWQGFLARAVEEKPLLSHHLGRCRPGRIGNGTLEIVAPAAFVAGYLSDPQHLRELEEVARNQFGHDVRVRVRPGDQAPEGGGQTAAPPAERRRRSREDLEKEVLRHPAVRAAVEILGGEVQTVRPSRPGGRSEDT